MFRKIFLFSVVFISSLFCNQQFFTDVEEAASWISDKINIKPEILVVLTAGIEGLEDNLENKVTISSNDIPHFPSAHAKGHEGKIIFGTYNKKNIVLMKGRYHYYEGLTPQQVVFPYFVLQKLGVKKMITTNAVGGIRFDLQAGDIVLIKDHINYMSENPLRGVAIWCSNQFTDMTEPYNLEMAQIAKDVSHELKLSLKEGVYIATMGPNYETKSEIKMFRGFGADVVGMSTLFEVIACNFLDIKVLAFSCVANSAADHCVGKLSHEEVLTALNQMGPKLKLLIENCIQKM
jgi:purine-nucleoside phosphorylase